MSGGGARYQYYHLIDSFSCECLKTYNLDSVWHYTLPGLVRSGISLHLLTDNDMILMIGNTIRGGCPQSCHDYTQANNKFVKDLNKKLDMTYRWE